MSDTLTDTLPPSRSRARGLVESIAEIGYRLETDHISPKATTRGGIVFRSQLEARYAQRLDDLGERWAYEPRVFGSAGRGYLPDFEILDASRPTFVEVKPTLDEVPAAQEKAAVIWDERPDALIIIVVAESFRYYASLQGGPWETWQELWK